MSADRSWEEAEAELLAESPELRVAMEASEPAYQVAVELIRARRELGLSQREIAERMGTTQSVVSRIERMDTTPSLTTVFSLAKALGRRVEIRFLVDEETTAPQTQDILGRVQQELAVLLEALQQVSAEGGMTARRLAKELDVPTEQVKKALKNVGGSLWRMTLFGGASPLSRR